MQLAVTVDAVLAAVVVRAVCAVLRVLATERGLTLRCRIEAGERVAIARLRAAAAEPRGGPAGARRPPGPPLAVTTASIHSCPTPHSRPSAWPTRSA